MNEKKKQKAKKKEKHTNTKHLSVETGECRFEVRACLSKRNDSPDQLNTKNSFDVVCSVWRKIATERIPWICIFIFEM